MTDYPTARELNALNNVTSEYEDSCYLGGAKTFASLLGKGWIEPFAGHNPNGDRYAITESGRAARARGKRPKVRQPSRLKTAPSRLAETPSRLETPKR